MTKQEVKDYVHFMHDPANIRRCTGCPENSSFSSGPNENRLPCGQYRCWVSCHCGRR